MRKIIEKFNIENIKSFFEFLFFNIIKNKDKACKVIFAIVVILLFFSSTGIAEGWIPVDTLSPSQREASAQWAKERAEADGWIMKRVSGLTSFLLTLTQGITSMAGAIFEGSINFSVNILIPSVINTNFIQAAWVSFRDLVNIFFIFILLYIAIGTILQLTQVDAKRMLTKVIIIALIINFSGFFTKIVIDATNVLAYDFLQSISGKTIGEDGSGQKLTTRINNLSKNDNAFREVENNYGKYRQHTAKSITNFFFIVTNIILTWVFLSGAILFLIRSLVLIFLYILSPIAFFSLIIPGQERHFSAWWQKLSSNALVAPVFLFFILVFLNMADNISSIRNDITNSITIDNNQPGKALMTLGIFISSFLIAYGILIGGMVASVKMGAVGAKVSALAGAAVTGYAVAQAGRQTLGRAGGALAQSETLQKMSKKKGVGGALARTGLRSSDWMSKRSFDIRNTPGGVAQQLAGTAGLDIGKATGTGGFKKSTEDKEKRKVEKQEEFMKMTGMDEAEKKEYLETNIPERFKRKVTDNIPILGRKNAKERARVREQMIGGTMSESEQEEKVQNTEAKYDQQINKVKTEGNYEAKKERWERKKEETNPELLEQRDKLKQNETKAAEAEREATEAEERGDSTKALRKRNDAGSWKYAAEQNKQTIDRLLKEREEARKAFADIEDDIGRLEKSKDIEIKNIKKGGGKKKTDMDKLAEKIKEVISSEETPASTGTTIRETLNEASVPRPQNDEELTERFKNI